MLGIAGTPASPFHEAKSAQLANPTADDMPIGYSELLEVGERDRQLAIVFATVARQFNLDPVKNAPARQTEHPHRRRSQHRDRARRKLPVDFVLALHATCRFA